MASKKAAAAAPRKRGRAATGGGADDLQAVQAALAATVAKAAPKLTATKKWGYDTWVGQSNVCAIMPAKAHVNLQLFGGAQLPDPHGLLEGTGKGMRHVKCRSVADARRAGLLALIRAAAKADAAG